jgi:hypothetical protein
MMNKSIDKYLPSYFLAEKDIKLSIINSDAIELRFEIFQLMLLFSKLQEIYRAIILCMK